jgi:hypothetical protein
MFGTPVAASRPEPVRAVRVPEKVRLAIIDMVEFGDDFVAAGKRHGVKAQGMRRWLGRAECISFLRQERARFRATVCAQNEAYLVSIRSGDNSMAAVRAIQVLEGLADTEVARPSNTAPGIVLRLVTIVQDAKAPPPAIEARVIDAIDAGE